MNNRTNLLKKRADTLAEYIVERCAKLEAENSWMRQAIAERDAELMKYGNAFFETIRKAERIERLDDGRILIVYKDKDKNEMNLIVPVNTFLYPIAEILLEKRERWGRKR